MFVHVDSTAIKSSEDDIQGTAALAGKPPFKAGSEYLTYQRILERDVLWPTDLPEAARDLLERLLVVDPAQRIGT